MIGTKIMKPITDRKAYAQTAVWCNKNNATIVDKGDYYEVIALTENSTESDGTTATEQTVFNFD